MRAKPFTTRCLGMLIVAGLSLGTSGTAAGWSKRMADHQNTGNVGEVPSLTPETVRDLQIVDLYPVGQGNATPIASGDLVFFGDWSGFIHVIDLEAKMPVIKLDAFEAGVGTAPRGRKVQATAVLGTATVPDPDAETGTREEERAYVAAFGDAERRGLYCFSVDAIRADLENLRAAQELADGRAYVCEGAPWPLEIMGPNQINSNQDGTGLFSKAQPIRVNGVEEIRDVLYQPSSGQGGNVGGEMWALDAYTGEKLWVWGSPVDVPPTPSTMWASTSMNKDRTIVYITTSDFAWPVPSGANNLTGGRAESIVALDAKTGEEVWYEQRRLVDFADLDVGSGVTVVDVEGEDGCHIVVNPDKDGCIYAYQQEADVPEVGDADYDPLRVGQQRRLWRKCFSVGGPSGGFNCMHAAFDGRRVFAQSNGAQVGTDDVWAFALDACTGDFLWASSSVGRGQFDGAVASGMLFQMSNTKLQIVSAEDGTNLATVPLTDGPTGGGGVKILPDGRILVPSNGGIAVLQVVPGSNGSPPTMVGNESFAGPYPAPVGPGTGFSPLTPLDVEGLSLPFMATKTELERDFYLELDRIRTELEVRQTEGEK